MKIIQELLQFSFINIDKPSGPTSFQISQYIKNSLNLSKTSHLGTLDPQVSGVLPIALNRACRLNDFFMHKDKIYIGIMRLHKDIPIEKLKQEMKSFIGKITQLPPLRSRVARKNRIREIKKFELIEKQDKDVLFFAEVQAGTYIRRLCDDLGKKIGGAHMLELRRIKASIFPEENSITLYEFDKAVEDYNNNKPDTLLKILIPAEEAIKEVLPIIQFKSKNIKQLLTGKPIHKSDLTIPEKHDVFALFQKDKFLGIYQKTNEKDIIARPKFILN